MSETNVLDDKELRELMGADTLNQIRLNRGRPYLACGARRLKHNDICRKVAGEGTDHTGRGRCKYHGGMTTGPKTEEGEAMAAQNSRKHGFYSDALSPEEREAYEGQNKETVVDLADEIRILRAKVLTYLKKWMKKQEALGEKATQVAYRVVTENEDGERISEIAGHYHAGSIEDRPLMKALNDLSKMVERQSRLNPADGEDLLSQINSELREASHGKITVAWGNREAQARQVKKE